MSENDEVLKNSAEEVRSETPCRKLDEMYIENLAENIEVYLRIKPVDEDNDIYSVINSTTLLTTVPRMDPLRVNVREPGTVEKCFTFAHVFEPENKQGDIYNHAVDKLVRDFIDGKSTTVMTYGTSGAGKTYTLLGTTNDPGVIPRALYALFKHITLEPDDSPLLKPIEHDEVVELEEEMNRIVLKTKKLILDRCKMKQSKGSTTYLSMQNVLDSETNDFTRNQDVGRFTVWVSFSEIYNEAMYDLLDINRLVGSHRPKLRLCENRYGSAYCKGLTMIPVRSGDEAYRLLKFGQRNLNYSSTSINSSSSRSHCIFTLQLVRSDGEDALVSAFNFCDLAGSERAKNTLSIGDRLKEAQHINTSLHVLGRCLQIIRDNQRLGDSKKHAIVPYRESKLTKMFHSALSGHETMSIIVNVNPLAAYLEETQNTLNFSTMAKEIILNKEHCAAKKVRICCRPSREVAPANVSVGIPVHSAKKHNGLVEDDSESPRQIKSPLNGSGTEWASSPSTTSSSSMERYGSESQASSVSGVYSMLEERENELQLHKNEIERLKAEIQRLNDSRTECDRNDKLQLESSPTENQLQDELESEIGKVNVQYNMSNSTSSESIPSDDSLNDEDLNGSTQTSLYSSEVATQTKPMAAIEPLAYCDVENSSVKILEIPGSTMDTFQSSGSEDEDVADGDNIPLESGEPLMQRGLGISKEPNWDNVGTYRSLIPRRYGGGEEIDTIIEEEEDDESEENYATRITLLPKMPLRSRTRNI